ncbi:UNVERIFIED_ORG: cell division protein FtsL [Pseudomonas lini]
MNSLSFALLSSCILLSGCNQFTYYKELEADKRLAIVTEKPEFVGGKELTRRITCSEPSPDALTALAASLSGETKAGVNVAGAYSESAASIGLRTQSIQLLRDQLFSICQAYANQGLSSYTYQTLLAKNQQNTIALMAIEQLTGVLKAPNVKLTTTAESYSSSLVKKQQQITEVEADILAIEDKNSDKAKELKATVDALKKDLKESQRAGAKAAGDVVVEEDQSSDSSGLTEKNVETITEAILELVQLTTVNTESVNTMFVCTDILQTSSFRGKAEVVASGASAQQTYTLLEKACENYVSQRLKTEISKLALETKVFSSTSPERLLTSPGGREDLSKAIEAINLAPQ